MSEHVFPVSTLSEETAGRRIVRRARERRPILMLLLALLPLYLLEIYHGLPNKDITWGYDANPLMPFIAAKKIFLDGWNTGWHSPYPNFHYYVLLLFLTPYVAVEWLLGNISGLKMDGGYPYGVQSFDTFFMHVAVITRLVSAAMALGCCYWIYRIGEALYSRRAGLFAACIVGFSPAIVYYVHTETLDVPMLFWLSAAMFCYVRAQQTFELRFYVGLAVLAAISAATKDYAYGAFVLLPIPLVLALARHSAGSLTMRSILNAVTDRRLVIAAVAFVISFAIAENWIWNFSGFINHVKVAGGLDNPEKYDVHTSFGRFDFISLQRLYTSVQALLFDMGWVGFFAGAAGLLYAVWRYRTAAVILLWPAASYYIFTVCQDLPAGIMIDRAYLTLAILFAIPGGLLLADLFGSAKAASRAVVAGALVLIALNGIAVDAAMRNDPRYRAEQWLAQNVMPAARVDLYGHKSELPRVDSRWKSSVLNASEMPLSDVQLTTAQLSPAFIKSRDPDWIVVSDGFMNTPSVSDPNVLKNASLDFADILQRQANYKEDVQFRSQISAFLGFPRFVAPDVTIFQRAR